MNQVKPPGGQPPSSSERAPKTDCLRGAQAAFPADRAGNTARPGRLRPRGAAADASRLTPRHGGARGGLTTRTTRRCADRRRSPMRVRRGCPQGAHLDQLQRGQALRAAAAGAGLGAVVEQAFAIECRQPSQGERRPGAVTQQALPTGVVVGLDARRRVDGEPAAVRPRVHGARGRTLEPTAAHEARQQAATHGGLHRGDGRRVDRGGGAKAMPPRC